MGSTKQIFSQATSRPDMKGKAQAESLNKSLLDKDWGAKIPDYITKGTFSLAVFLMSLLMRGDWLMFLAHYWRSQSPALAPPSSLLEHQLADNNTETELARWFNQNFAGFWSLYFPAATTVSYIFFFGVGGYLHVKYYVRQADSPEDWKCQPNKWLSSKEEVHEIVVGWFSVTLGSALSAALATWVVNGGYTSLYYTPGQYGLLWAVLEGPLVFIATDYITYWHHRVYHMPFLYKHFHKLHHTYKQPTAFSVTAIHPVEFLNIQAIYIAPMFLMKIYAPVYCFMLLYIYYHGIIDHSGITFKKQWWQPWQPDCIFHDNHHQYFHVNFGFNIEFWDHLHGTARRKDRIYREDIFWGKGKDIAEATSEEIEADVGQRKDENPLAYDNNKNKYL